MSFYLDSSIIGSFFVPDAHSGRADSWFASQSDALWISSWAKTEFAALIHRRNRNGELSTPQQRQLFDRFEEWSTRNAGHIDIDPGSGELALMLVKDARLKLSAADALHLALSTTSQLTLATFDERLASAASLRGQAVLVP
jgi:predicted nucleic acid-binding protein